MKKLVALLCAISLWLPAFCSSAVANGIGTVYMNTKETLADGLEYAEIFAANDSGKQLAYTLTYAPGSDTEIAVGTGGGIYGRKSASDIAEYEKSAGKNIVASVNGNTFSLQSGVTDGILITDGKLLSWNKNGSNAVALKSDGGIITGEPDITLTVKMGSQSHEITALNKWPAQESGICLLTDDFATSTKSLGSRIEVILRPNTDSVKFMEETFTCTVISVNTTANTRIPDGHIALSLPATHTSASDFKALSEGDTLTVTSTSTEWKDITFAIGTDKAIVSERKAVNQSTLSDDSKAIARTAVGIKDDGTLLFFACDGDGTYGKGLTTPEISAELISMGVKTAYYLDLGSSTTVTKGTELANHPSAGEERLIGSTVLFINTNTSNVATKLRITPSTPTVFKNGFVRLSCEAVDAGGDPTGDALTDITYSVSSSLGSVSGTLFKAGSTAGNLTLTAKAKCNGEAISGTTEISIITALDGIKATSSTVYVPDGGRADVPVMGVRATKDVHLYGYALKWSLSGVSETTVSGAVISCKYGYLDNNMIFYANEGYEGVSFTLNAKYGYTTVPIKIVIGKPDEVITDFDDRNVAFSGYIKGGSSQTFKYSAGKFNTYGLKYTGNGIIYKTPVTLGYDAESISMWINGTATEPYAVVELKNGTRKELPLLCEEDYSFFNGWKKYTLSLPDDTARIISPLCSKYKMSCTVDEITVSYGSHPPAFTDIASSWAKKEIELLYALDISSGYGSKGNLQYKPQNSITRAEFAKMIVIYYGLDTGDYKDTVLDFSDASSIPAWALPYVKAAVATGLINGSSNPDGSLSFLPNDKITRAQLVTIIGRKLNCISATITFADKAAVPSYALEGLAKCVKAGIISGYPDGSFKPGASLTRAEVAKVIANLYKYSYNK